MIIKDISSNEKIQYNSAVSHPLQSFEWGEFRKKTHIKVITQGFFEKEIILDGFQMTIHRIPYTPWTIGYLPKGSLPTKELIQQLKKIGKEEKCIFIQLEPNVEKDSEFRVQSSEYNLQPSFHPLFTKYTFILDLEKSEEELLKNMHQKTRYNIRVAQKHGVEVVEDNSDEAFETYWKLIQETTKRQRFFAHSKAYHTMQWNILNATKTKNNGLISHLFFAKYNGEVLTAWLLFTFKDTLYYPYGASSSHHREVMASNVMMWEVIRYGKRIGMTKFDMWGAMSDMPDKNDPWYGFHKFKQGYGARHVEFIGSFDLVIQPALYTLYKIADKTRWALLKLKK